MTLRDVLDEDAVAEQLANAGIGAAAARRLAAQFARCARVLLADGTAAHGTAAHAWFVPGRIEVLGKHTDYAGGRSLLAAVERGFCAVAVPRDDAHVAVHDVAGARHVAFSADGAAPPPSPAWAVYPHTVVTRIARDFPDATDGADIAFVSDLPPAAGMSSSSAFVTAVFLTLAAVRGLDRSPVYRATIGGPDDLADYLGAVENGWAYRGLPGGAGVGTRGGSEDHVAMLCARPAALVQYAFRPVRFERAVPLPPGHVFVVAASGVTAEKSGAARKLYNRVSDRADALERLWHDHAGAPASERATKARAGGTAERAAHARADGTAPGRASLGALLASAPDAYDRLRVIVERHAPPAERTALLHRLEQFAAETFAIIPAAGDALHRGDLAAFGEQVHRSHDLAARLLGNQVPETQHLARSARRLGAVAASAFGAGFGGSVWAMVPKQNAAAFSENWRDAYVKAFPQHTTTADFAAAPAGRGALRLP